MNQNSLMPDEMAISKYANFLSSKYSNYPVMISDKGPYNPSKVFIKLAIVKKQKVSKAEADEFTRLTLMGEIDQILHVKEQIEMEDLLKDENTRLVLVEGAPGIGKSTLAWELCRKWKKMHSLKRFSLIILIPLREEWVQKAVCIFDLIPHKLKNRVGEEIENREGNGILFIFDGFDEFPKELCENSIVMNIIRGLDYLPQATVLVTSRPAATAHLHSLLRTNIDKRVEVVGFSDREIYQYAKSNLEGTRLYDDFVEYLSVNPAIKGMMYNPLNSAIVVEAYRESHQSGKSIPYTQTELYAQLALYRMSRYFSERGEISDELPNRLEDIEDGTLYDLFRNIWAWFSGGIPRHRNTKTQLLALGELAFNARINEQIIFKFLPGNGETLGLLMKHTSIYGRNKAEIYTFLHLTLQEYIAAFYFSQLSTEKQKEYFAKYSNLKQMNFVWRFVAGLTKMQGVGWDVFKGWRAEWVEGNDSYTYDYDLNAGIVVVQPFIIQCLYEAHDAQSCNDVFGSFSVKYPERVFNPYQVLTSYDAFALGYCVTLCGNVWNIYLKHTGVDLNMLGHGMRAVDRDGGGYIDNLDLWGSNVPLETPGNFLRMPHKIIEKIRSLNLRGCGINETGLENLAKSVPYFSNLASLNISYNPLAPGSTTQLLKALREHGKLEELHYRGLVIGLEEVSALLGLIHSSKKLKRLCVGESYTRNITFPPDVLRQLIKGILSPSSLQSVYIRTNPSTRPLDHIEKISSSITTLQFTSFYEVGSDDEDDDEERDDQQEFLSNPDLRSSLKKTAKGSTNFGNILRKNRSLKELWLELSLDRDELHCIVHSLEENTSLERLILYRRRHSNYFSQAEREVMDPRVVISEF